MGSNPRTDVLLRGKSGHRGTLMETQGKYKDSVTAEAESGVMGLEANSA